MPSGIFELAIVIIIAAALGVLAKLFKQPILLAYLATGIIIGYFGFLNIQDRGTFQVFSDLGIMFLLFLVGLEINFTSLRLVGRASVLIGSAQILGTFLIGFGIAHWLGFALVPASYLALAFTFSSTVIVVKLLSEKRELNSLYGKLSIGLLLVQDVVAVFALLFLGGLQANQGPILQNIMLTLGKGILLVAVVLWLGRKALPRMFDGVARSQELLFLIGLAWVFLLAVVAMKIGFSIEIAGFLAGLALANSLEHFQIANRIRPLRDFFILIFFVILGSQLVFSHLSGLFLPILVFSLFVLAGKPLIMLVIMGLMRYRKRTSFFTGLTVAQISEFSLILAALGLKLGHIGENVSSLITAVGIVTIMSSTYFITHAEWLFRRFHRYLKPFELRVTDEDAAFEQEFKKPIVLIGAHRIGQSITAHIPHKDLLVIDFDPDVITLLKRKNIDYLFGDISDPDIFEQAHLAQARLVIGTSPDFEDNVSFLHALRRLHRRPKTIIRAENEKEAILLYNAGADYVLLPHFTSGQYLGKTIALDPEMKILEHLKKKDLEMLHRQEIE